MADKNIQMTQRSSDNTAWDNLFPITKGANIVRDDGTPDYVRVPAYAVATGSANTYVVTLSPAPTAYIDGMAITVKINVVSTGASTLNVNGLGAKAIKDSLGNAITSGGLKANTPYTLRYESTSGSFIVQGKGGGGTATADKILSGYTATVDTGQITGTMVNHGGYTDPSGNYADGAGILYSWIPYGAYLNDSGSGSGTPGIRNYDANFIASNIASGKSIFGVVGTYDPRILTAGDTVIYKNSGVTDHWGASYQVERSVKLTNASGTVRVTFQLQTLNGSYAAYGKIYVNGVARGIERITTSTSAVTFVEDISINSGDTVQLYCWEPGGQTYRISLFQLSTGSALFPIIA